MRGISEYLVKYRLHQTSPVDHIHVYALSKEEAYDYAVNEVIPDTDKYYPYSAWVQEVHYLNGRTHLFNTHEGKPY